MAPLHLAARNFKYCNVQVMLQLVQRGADYRLGMQSTEKSLKKQNGTTAVDFALMQEFELEARPVTDHFVQLAGGDRSAVLRKEMIELLDLDEKFAVNHGWGVGKTDEEKRHKGLKYAWERALKVVSGGGRGALWVENAKAQTSGLQGARVPRQGHHVCGDHV
jgi:hypothetical protein